MGSDAAFHPSTKGPIVVTKYALADPLTTAINRFNCVFFGSNDRERAARYLWRGV